MAGAARMHFAEHGEDPRLYTLVATGGAAPLHACRLARKLGMSRVVCPLRAGVAATIGLLVAAPRVHLSHAYFGRLDQLDWRRVERIFEQMVEHGRDVLAQVPGATDVSVRRFADLRYHGQGFEVEVELPDGPLEQLSVAEIRERFDSEYRRLYGRTLAGFGVEAVNWRVALEAPGAVPISFSTNGAAAATANAADALRGERRAYFPETDGYVVVPVYDRYKLGAGATAAGPAIVEERESTVVVACESTFSVGAGGALTIDLS